MARNARYTATTYVHRTSLTNGGYILCMSESAVDIISNFLSDVLFVYFALLTPMAPDMTLI